MLWLEMESNSLDQRGDLRTAYRDTVLSASCYVTSDRPPTLILMLLREDLGWMEGRRKPVRVPQ